MPETTKKFLIKLGIVFGIFVVLTSILVSLIYVSKFSWKMGLKSYAQKVLCRAENREVELGDYLELNSTFSTSMACYKINRSDEYAVIMRIPSIGGPIPAVFKYQTGAEKAVFVDYGVEIGRAGVIFDKKVYVTGIKYWEEKIPSIINGAAD